jgi:mannitol 2-dehydrogenase
MTRTLSLATLSDLPDTVATPLYQRSDLRAGIVHIGVGNFHRAHQAVYLDSLFNLGRDHDWAIIGAGVKSFDAKTRAALIGQDWLTTVVELDPSGYSARVTGAMIGFCPVEADALIDQLADPAIRIVSLTITEGGYFVDAASGGFDAAHPDIQRDARGPAHPETVFGLLLAGLQRRRTLGLAPFAILSCDNLPENGHVTRAAMLGLAGLMPGDLHDWVAENVAFPSSMVDCITPATSARERQMVTDRFGINDAAPVVCEPFRQWVMEDNFPQGRPALELVGVEFVTDVAPYETMKLRILNAGHAAIAYPAALLGHEFVHEAMADPDIAAWLTHLMTLEVIPILPPIDGVEYAAYLSTCAERFANPAIGDTIARLCLDGSNRQPKFVLPSIADALAAGTSVDLLALEVAFWCEYLARSVENGAGYTVQDERAEGLVGAAMRAAKDPAAFLAQDFFGDLATDSRFLSAFARQFGQIRKQGTRAVLQDLCRQVA